LLGEALTLADITAGTSLYRYFELEIERPQLAQVERWYRTLQQRAPFREHVMIPFEGIHVLMARRKKAWMAGTSPGHDEDEKHVVARLTSSSRRRRP
jgi:glutathione S-transferase